MQHGRIITHAPPHCDGSSLGPGLGFEEIIPKTNQLTWKSATELLINAGSGGNYQYTMP